MRHSRCVAKCPLALQAPSGVGRTPHQRAPALPAVGRVLQRRRAPSVRRRGARRPVVAVVPVARAPVAPVARSHPWLRSLRSGRLPSGRSLPRRSAPRTGRPADGGSLAGRTSPQNDTPPCVRVTTSGRRKPLKDGLRRALVGLEARLEAGPAEDRVGLRRRVVAQQVLVEGRPRAGCFQASFSEIASNSACCASGTPRIGLGKLWTPNSVM